jgi:hypothetical protein
MPTRCGRLADFPDDLRWRSNADRIVDPGFRLHDLFYAQTLPENRLTFDAASVKLASAPSGMTFLPGGGITVPRWSGIQPPNHTGGPGTADPGRIHHPLISPKALLAKAYDSYSDIVAPQWLESRIVTVQATMPASLASRPARTAFPSRCSILQRLQTAVMRRIFSVLCSHRQASS